MNSPVRHRVPGSRSVDGIPFETIVIDPAALVMTSDFLAQEGVEVDELLLGHAILLYLEAEERSTP